MTWPARLATVAALTALMGSLIPVTASAHSLLVSSDPSAGQRLATGPGVVVLEFDEPLNTSLSTASVTDPTGHQWRGMVTGSLEIRISVQTNVQGTYAVDWTSVSLDDGHHISGSFTFDVGGSPAAPEAGASTVQTAPQVSDVLLGIGRWVEALALLALLGQLLLRLLAQRLPQLPWVRARLALAPAALAFGLIVVVAGAAVASGGLSGAGFLAFFTAIPSGPARLARLVFEGLATIAAWRGSATIWLWTGGALGAVAASGHAAAVTPAWWGITIDSVHLGAAGLWAGGISALATQRPPGGWRSIEARRLLVRFSPVALAAFAITVAAGVLDAVLQLGSLAALVGTPYGRVLLAKMALIGTMLPLSFIAWRRRRPRPRFETAIAACVVAAAALLASFPSPPTEAAQQAAQRAAATPSQGLPGSGDVTLAAGAGTVLVGVSLEPGRPGANRVLVYLGPVAGSRAAAALLVHATAGGVTRPMQRCGATCREATFTLRGGEALNIDVLGNTGGRARFTIPQLPAPAGAAQLALMQDRMHQLSSYHVAETLSSGVVIISSDYASVAPNRSVFAVNGLTDEIWIGTTEWTRQSASQTWQAAANLPANKVPSFVWDYFEPLVDAHIVGHEDLHGVRTTVVSAFGMRAGTALWFRFWIDGGGLVHQLYMDATGHFMVDRYVSYNTSTSINPPP